MGSLNQKAKNMKAKHLFLAIAALLAVGGLWLAGTNWRTHAVHNASTGLDVKTPNGGMDVGFTTPDGRPKPGQMLRPPDPNRRFTDFTPEQRVQFARQGHGPGG